jgi:hypothetical protein
MQTSNGSRVFWSFFRAPRVWRVVVAMDVFSASRRIAIHGAATVALLIAPDMLSRVDRCIGFGPVTVSLDYADRIGIVGGNCSALKDSSQAYQRSSCPSTTTTCGGSWIPGQCGGSCWACDAVPGLMKEVSDNSSDPLYTLDENFCPGVCKGICRRPPDEWLCRCVPTPWTDSLSGGCGLHVTAKKGCDPYGG